MKSNKALILLGSICLVLLLVVLPFMGACAAPAPAQEVKIDTLTAAMGSSGYTFSFALTDIVSKNHPWLRLRGIETQGISENIMTLIKEPAKRPNTIVFANDSHAFHARMGRAPYEKYDTLRAIALFQPARHFAATVDRKYQTWQDLVGKKVGIFPPIGTSGYMQWTDILKYGYNIKPEDIQWVAAALGPGIDALSTGRLDAAWGLASPPPMNSPAPRLQELISSRDTYFVGFSKEAVAAAKAKSEYPISGAVIPAKTLSPSQPEFVAQVQYLSWWADITMDEKVVYEIAKTIYENVDKFATYDVGGKAMTKTNLAEIPVGEAMFHPGAVKFYKEKKLKIGVE